MFKIIDFGESIKEEWKVYDKDLAAKSGHLLIQKSSHEEINGVHE